MLYRKPSSYADLRLNVVKDRQGSMVDLREMLATLRP
jgi:hypothetical protein